MGKWTMADLVALTMQALDYDVYCEACGVVPLDREGDKYCLKCTEAILDSLAAREAEQTACDGGLY